MNRLRTAISIAVVVCSVSYIIATGKQSPLAPYLFVAEIGLCAAMVAVAIVAELRRRRLKRALAERPPSRYMLDGKNRLHVYHRDLALQHGEAVIGDEYTSATIDLDQVRYVSWWASPIAPALDDEFVVLWDRDPVLEMTDTMPRATVPDADSLGMVSLVDLALQPDVRRAVFDALAARRAHGLLDANVDLETGKAITEKNPPLADDVEVRRGRIVKKRIGSH